MQASSGSKRAAEAAGPLSALDDPDPVAALRAHGFALIGAAQLRSICGVGEEATRALEPAWSDLPPDAHLRDVGGYRRRRHASYLLDLVDGTLTRTPHRAHWQSPAHNPLHGGVARWFEPVDPAIEALPAWGAALRHLGLLFAEAAAHDAPDLWFIEAHQIRIETAQGIGRPSPQGAHRAGVDYVALILVGRSGVRGGETRVFETDSALGLRFTMSEPWSALLVDDARVVQETSPLLLDGASGWRDSLVLTYRRGGFQEPAQAQRR